MDKQTITMVIGIVLICIGVSLLIAYTSFRMDPKDMAVESVRIPDPGGERLVDLEKGTYEMWIEVTERYGFIGSVGVLTEDERFIWEGSSEGVIEESGEVRNLGEFTIPEKGRYILYSQDGVTLHVTEPMGSSYVTTLVGIVLLIAGAALLAVGLLRWFSSRE
jgi:hypothetical protein